MQLRDEFVHVEYVSLSQKLPGSVEMAYNNSLLLSIDIEILIHTHPYLILKQARTVHSEGIWGFIKT